MLELHRHSLQMRSCEPAQKHLPPWSSELLQAQLSPPRAHKIGRILTEQRNNSLFWCLCIRSTVKMIMTLKYVWVTFLSSLIRDKRLILQMFHMGCLEESEKNPCFCTLECWAIACNSVWVLFITFLPCFIQHKCIFYLYFYCRVDHIFHCWG